jgi:uncharacterized protein YdhG (YjbR/CyaY superfamily)
MTVIDDFLAGISEPQRSVLHELRQLILEFIPDAEECISYDLPCFKVNGKSVAGFDAYKNHNSYFPFSGQVFKEMPHELEGYVFTKGSLHFSKDACLPRELVQRLIEVRLEQIHSNGR